MELLEINLGEISKTGIIVGILAFLIGLRYPDWDFKFKLKHRSIFTHSPLILFVLYMIYKNEGGTEFRYFLISFSMAMGIHLIYDFFPKKWMGNAFIYLPLKISLGERYTKQCLLVSIIFSNYLSINFMENESEYIIFFIVGLLILLSEVKKEGKFFRPIFFYFLVYFGIGYFKYDKLFNWAVLPAIDTIKTGLRASS
jgi:hypothetical protein